MQTLQKTSILYLDDEETCLEVFRHIFSDEYDVRIVSTLAEAREALSKDRFDIVISDQLMPETDGLTFLREVTQTYPDTFRMMLTGSIGVGDVIREVCAGVLHLFITKPWTEPNMRQALERARLPKNNFKAQPRNTKLDGITRNAA